MNNALIKTTLIAVASLTGMWATIAEPQDSQALPKKASAFMQRKLDYTSQLVDGLATENFEKISKGAQDLMLLSHEADWNVVTSPDYLKMSNDFRRATERLRTQGQEKNLDGATLAYFEVTLSCIRCHKQLRSQAMKIEADED